MDLTEYAALLRRQWRWMAALALVGALAGFVEAKSTAPTYEASSKVFVSVSNGSTVSDLVQGSTFTQNLVQSYAQLATTPAVLQPVISNLGLRTTPVKLAKMVSADTPLNTVIIEISARAGNPEIAAEIANAVAVQLPQTVEDVSPSLGSQARSVSIKTISDAIPPRFAISPRTKFSTATGFALGLVLAVAGAVLLKLLDNRVRDRGDLEAVSNAPVLGEVPRRRGTDGAQVALLAEPRGVRAEAYRRVRSNFEFVMLSRSPGPGMATHGASVVVSSADQGEGKSTLAVNFALALAELGKRVVLVDADVRRPTIANVTGLEGAVGLTSVLVGRASLDDVLQPWGAASLDVLTSGPVPPNPLQILDGETMAKLLLELRSRYDVVVVDSPPLLAVADASVLARETDGVLLVARTGATRKRHLEAAVRTLDVARTGVVGMVLTRVSSSGKVGYYQAEETRLATLARTLRGVPRRLAPAGRQASKPHADA